jgi:hypothetical protein
MSVPLAGVQQREIRLGLGAIAEAHRAVDPDDGSIRDG